MRNLILLPIMLTLSACGGTSNLQNSQNPNSKLNLSAYNAVIINDFSDDISKAKNDPKIIAEGKKFADMIAEDVMAKKAFTSVTRNTEAVDNTIIVDGKITQYEEGNAGARFMIGMGAGSSHFDATVNVKDGSTKEILGTIKVDQMSWALGGALAASQDVNSHMKAASTKISSELADAKKLK